MKLYRLISGPDDSAFCMRISTLLNKGWQLHGSPSLANNGENTIVAQAVVKEIENEEFNSSTDLTSY